MIIKDPSYKETARFIGRHVRLPKVTGRLACVGRMGNSVYFGVDAGITNPNCANSTIKRNLGALDEHVASGPLDLEVAWQGSPEFIEIFEPKLKQ